MVKAGKSWGRLSRILSREGADKRVSVNFFKAGGSGGPTVWGGDVGADPKDIEGAGKLHARGRA